MIGRLARKLLLAAASFAAAFPAHAEVQWLRSGAPLPDGFDYITVGTEANNVNAGTTLFVCRAAFQHGVYPGKVIGGKCDIGSGGREYTLSPYEMAAAGRGSYYWGRPGEAATPIVGGREGGRPLIICRAEHRSSPDGRTFVSHGMHSGRVIGSNCHIGYGGLEFIKSDYEVLYQSTTQAAAPARPAAPPALAPAPAQPAVVSSTEFGHRVALVIGNGDYRVANRLSNPTNDANDMAAVLRRLGFDVVEGKNLDRRAMDDAIREFGRKLDGADLALFFYAGHGLQVGGKKLSRPDRRQARAGGRPPARYRRGWHRIGADGGREARQSGVSRRLPRQSALAQPRALARHALNQRRGRPRADPKRRRDHDRLCDAARKRCVRW
jgi:hypothetical protein